MCNQTGTEWPPNEDFASWIKPIEEFHTSNVYTVPASSKDPLTENDRKSMTANVKSSACKTLLGRQRDESGKNDGEFVEDDQQIFNFARDDLSKNAATKIPARLLEPLCSYRKSIGQITCGDIRGTCFLVAHMLAITNHHVFRAINQEREERQDPNLPITVTFDYFYPEQREDQITAVEVDEARDPELESSQLDYKLFYLKENEGLRDRVVLGPIVRSRPVQEGLVIILGHPAGSEMHEETCVVVSSHSWREQLKQRHEKHRQSQRNEGTSAGVHMTNNDLQRYCERLPYDTSLFSGASGSPVFDLNGKIVAIHTQGYTLNVEGGKCSLMEFGVQFSAICDDMRRRNLNVEQFFPNFEEEESFPNVDEEPMDED